ncbi:MAG: protein kinase domain-containing protein, partial [Candidatus Acidiferrales bacterium]
MINIVPFEARLVAGQTFGHYHIEEKLGAGGMGEVYRARDTRLERRVALKLIGEGLGGDENARGRLLHEARAASALNHPHICTVYEVGEAEGQAYIAMELVEGRALSAMIPAEGLPVESVLRYGAQMADGLAHAHERGIVHRDLKSANVVITTEGRAKVLDFGLAKRLTPAVEEATRSRASLMEAGALAGTLHYMAPEALRGEATDARSDLWALGVVLSEMASGKLPFEGKTGYELSSAILQQSPAALPARAPAGLRAVIQRCLAKEPGQRYQRASEVRAALEALQSSAAVPAAPLGRVHSLRWALWVLGIGALLVGGGIVAAVIRGVPFNVGLTRIERPAAPSGPGFMLCKASANPEANEYLQRGGLLLSGQFEPARARQMFEKALELDPHFASARVAYGLTFVLLLDQGYSNDPSVLYQGEEELRRALQDEPACGNAHGILAGVYLLQGRKELVPGELERALTLNPNARSPQMWSLLYHRLNGDYGQAQETAQKLVEADPTFFPARTMLGEVFREQGKLPEAVRQQEKVLEQDLTNIIAVRHLVRAYLDQGDLRRARATLERARPEDRKNYGIRVAWALLLAREGKRAEALTEMDPEVQKYAEVHVFTTAEAAAFYAV